LLRELQLMTLEEEASVMAVVASGVLDNRY
jgi:hypothetical protein